MSDTPAPPLPRLASIDRSQLLLHTLDVERLIDEDHSARSIWHLVGRMNLGLYHAKIAAVQGHAGRDHTAPQLLISLWLYAYSQGISSAREIARQCAYEFPRQTGVVLSEFPRRVSSSDGSGTFRKLPLSSDD